MSLLEIQTAFYRDHGLTTFAAAVAALDWTDSPADDAGFAPVAILPPLSVQRAATQQLLEAMSAPTDALPEAGAYGGYWAASVEVVADCEILDRPEGAYAVWMRDAGFPPETLGLTCSKLVKDMAANGLIGLTVHEFLVLQRLKAFQHGDHRWSCYHGHEDHPPGIQWLPNARSGKKVFQGYWVAKSGQVQIGACATGSKKPTRGAHPVRITAAN